jgi:hypothetical protein
VFTYVIPDRRAPLGQLKSLNAPSLAAVRTKAVPPPCRIGRVVFCAQDRHQLKTSYLGIWSAAPEYRPLRSDLLVGDVLSISGNEEAQLLLGQFSPQYRGSVMYGTNPIFAGRLSAHSNASAFLAQEPAPNLSKDISSPLPEAQALSN